MLFKVDENLHPDVVALLRHRGHDTESGRQQGMRGQLDAVFLQTERGGLGLNVAIDRTTTESMCRRERRRSPLSPLFTREGYTDDH
jgi:hypothetical protein